MNIYTEISNELNLMIDLDPKHDIEESLSSTMTIYDICQDVEFVKIEKVTLKYTILRKDVDKAYITSMGSCSKHG